MHMAHYSGNTSGMSKSSSDWFNSTGFLGDASVAFIFGPPGNKDAVAPNPSRKKKAVVFTNVTTNAYQGELNAGFSKVCEIFKVRGIESLKYIQEFHTPCFTIHAFMTSRLDYCNALLGGCSARLINKLQMVQNAAARVLTRTREYDHISPVLSTLHWLPIKHCIDFKILLITYKALNGLAPQYLSELLSHYSPSRPLRSQNSGHLIIPRISKSTAGDRSFSYLAPKLWNNLPNTVREADTLCQV